MRLLTFLPTNFETSVGFTLNLGNSRTIASLVTNPPSAPESL